MRSSWPRHLVASGSCSTEGAASCSTATPRTRATLSTSSVPGRTSEHTPVERAPPSARRLRDVGARTRHGRIVEVTDAYADNPPGTNGDHANHLVMDIG